MCLQLRLTGYSSTGTSDTPPGQEASATYWPTRLAHAPTVVVLQKLEKENMRAPENNATHFFQNSYFQQSNW